MPCKRLTTQIESASPTPGGVGLVATPVAASNSTPVQLSSPTRLLVSRSQPLPHDSRGNDTLLASSWAAARLRRDSARASISTPPPLSGPRPTHRPRRPSCLTDHDATRQPRVRAFSRNREGVCTAEVRPRAETLQILLDVEKRSGREAERRMSSFNLGRGEK